MKSPLSSYDESNKAVEKWLFCFCLCVSLCGCGKSKCATCAVAKKLKNKKCAVAKNKTSLRWLSDRAIKSLGSVSKNVRFMSVCLKLQYRHRVSGNAQICETLLRFISTNSSISPENTNNQSNWRNAFIATGQLRLSFQCRRLFESYYVRLR